MRHVSSPAKLFRSIRCSTSTLLKQTALRPAVRPSDIRDISRFRYQAENLSKVDKNNLTTQEQREVEQLTAEESHLKQFGEKIAKCEKILQYSFKDKYRCVEALNDRKCLPNDGISGVIYNNNNRMAILGDILLDKYLCERWLKAGGSRVARASYGMVRSALATNESLGRLGRKIGLEHCIIVEHRGDHLLGDMTIATAIEALIAAVYLDGGDEALRVVMERFNFDHPLLQPWSEQALRSWRKEERKRVELRRAERAKMQLNGQRKRLDAEKEEIEAALGWRK